MTIKAPIKAVIELLGTDIVLTNPGTSTYDPITDVMVAGDGESVTTKADVMPTKRRIELAIADGDIGITIPPQPNFIVSTQTTAVLDGVKYQVISINPLYAFNELTAMELQLGRVGNG